MGCYPGATRFALAPGYHISRRWRCLVVNRAVGAVWLSIAPFALSGCQSRRWRCLVVNRAPLRSAWIFRAWRLALYFAPLRCLVVNRAVALSAWIFRAWPLALYFAPLALNFNSAFSTSRRCRRWRFESS